MTFIFIRLENYDEKTGHFATLRGALYESLSDLELDFEELDLANMDLTEQALALKVIIQSKPVTHVHFEWLHDLENRSILLDILLDSGVSWSVFASLSEIWRSGASCLDFKLLSLAHRYSNLLTVFTWDLHLIKKISGTFPKLSHLMDYQDLSTRNETFECCTWIQEDDRVVLGISGQLYGYRGVDLLVWRFLLLSNFKIILWGSYKENDLAFFTKFLLRIFRGSNKIFIRGEWISTDAELNHFYQHIDGFFLDGSRYPNPSGMANRALSFGIPLLVQEGPGHYAAESEENGLVHMADFRFLSNRVVRSLLINRESVQLDSKLSLTGQINSMKEVWSKLLS